MGIRMDDGESQLCPCLVFLVHEGGAAVLHDGTVQDAVGVGVVEEFRIGGNVLHAVDGEEVTGVTVIHVLEGGGLAVAGVVAALEVEVAAKGFGVDDAASHSLRIGCLLDALVHGFVVGSVTGGIVCVVRERTVVAVQIVLGHVPVNVCRYGPSRHAQPLAEEEEAPRLHAVVVAGIQGETVVGLAAGAVGKFLLGVEDALLHVVSPAEVELGLEKDGGVFGELVLQAHSEAVAVGEAVAAAVGVGDEGGAIGKVCFLVGGFFDVGDAAVVEVVSAEVHLVAKEVPVAVHAAHPGGGDAVGIAPAATATSHSAAASHHGIHHGAGEVVETAVVGIVGIGNDAELALVSEFTGHEGSLPAPVVHGAFLGGKVVTAAGHGVSKDAVHHAGTHGKVDDGLFFTVVDPGEFGLFALLLHHFHLLYKLCRDVLGCELRVVQEEGLAGDGYLGDRLAVGGDGAVLGNLDAGELLQKVHQHVVITYLEGRCIVFHRVLLYDDGIAHCRYGCRIEHFGVEFQFQGAKVQVLLYGDLLFGGDVAHNLGLEGVRSLLHLVYGAGALSVCEGVLGGAALV